MSSDGAIVELSVVGYEFPVASDREAQDEYDANWLVIDGSVRTAEGRAWSWTEPSLLTSEARELTTWLRSAATTDGAVPIWDDARLTSWLADVESDTVEPWSSDGADESDGLLLFLEPNLGFSVAARAEAMVHLRVHFSLEALPEPPIGAAGGFPLYSFFVTLTLDPADLMAAVEQWERDLAPYPIKRIAP
ncbi:WapI family immunity protein [Pengzhenrongella sp.]|uniref:WapI family immunity protein n=1 Tax=Pengzhenrongella sp. TaxID=2888820 RepID=UPI002F920B5A